MVVVLLDLLGAVTAQLCVNVLVDYKSVKFKDCVACVEAVNEYMRLAWDVHSGVGIPCDNRT